MPTEAKWGITLALFTIVGLSVYTNNIFIVLGMSFITVYVCTKLFKEKE